MVETIEAGRRPPGRLGASPSSTPAGCLQLPGRPDRQVVKPAVYIAAGISGATQHMGGHEGLEEHHRHQQGRRGPIFSIAPTWASWAAIQGAAKLIRPSKG